MRPRTKDHALAILGGALADEQGKLCAGRLEWCKRGLTWLREHLR